MASFFCSGVFREGGRPIGLSLGLGAAPAFGCAGADKIAFNIGEASENREHQAPGAGAGVGPRFRQGSKLRLGVRDALDDGEQIEGAAREAVNPRHRHHVAGGEAAEHPQHRISAAAAFTEHFLTFLRLVPIEYY